MMMLQIGNETPAMRSQSQRGFSFFELMVTVAVLSSGLVLLYNAFFLAIDYAQRVSCRLYAINLLDKKINEIQMLFQEKSQLIFNEKLDTETVNINHRKVKFQFTTNVEQKQGIEGVYQVDLNLSWDDGKRISRLARAFYMSQYDGLIKKSLSSL